MDPERIAPFARTSCSCAADTANCRRQAGPLAPGDAERIAAFLGVAVAELPLWASPGAVVRMGDGPPFRIPTITPQMVDGGARCVWLTEDNRCRVHPVAPAGCAYFDTHQTEVEYTRRANWLYRAIMEDWQVGGAGYQRLRSTLSQATVWRPRVVPERLP